MERLGSSEVVSSFAAALRNKANLVIETPQQNMNTYWDDKWIAVIETAKTEIGFIKKINNPWISDATWQLIQSRKIN